MIMHRIESRERATGLLNHVIETGDETILEPYVLAERTQQDRNANSIMAVAGERPSLFVEFMTKADEFGFLTEQEIIELCHKRKI